MIKIKLRIWINCQVDEFCMLFNEQINMSELQPPPGAVPASAAPPPPPPAGGAAGGGGYSHDGNKQTHKSYVRGRGGQHARTASRR